jgi:hypothetical protein
MQKETRLIESGFFYQYLIPCDDQVASSLLTLLHGWVTNSQTKFSLPNQRTHHLRQSAKQQSAQQIDAVKRLAGQNKKFQ